MTAGAFLASRFPYRLQRAIASLKPLTLRPAAATLRVVGTSFMDRPDLSLQATPMGLRRRAVITSAPSVCLSETTADGGVWATTRLF